ncbi:spore germination protein KC [Paenibacillus mucilaginosus]
MMIKPIIAMAGLGSLLLLSGCWDLQELNRTSLFTGLALEPGTESKIRVTGETLNASEAQAIKGGEGAAPVINYAVEANTTSEAMVKFNQILDRSINVSHVGVIIIDERLARKGLNHYIDVLQRSRYVREDVLILVAKNYKASDILKVLFPRGPYPTFKIHSQLDNLSKLWGGALRSRLFDFNQALAAKGREPTLSAITLIGDPALGKDAGSIKSPTPKATAELVGTAVFQKDKLLGFISLDDTRMLSMAAGELKGTTLSVPLEKKGEYAAIRLLNWRSQMKVSLEHGKPEIRLVLYGKGNVPSTDIEKDLSSVLEYQKLEELTSSYIRNQMMVTIRHIQGEYGVDPIGFGEKLYRRHYRQFLSVAGKWNESFAQSPIEVEVHITLQRSELKTNNITKIE